MRWSGLGSRGQLDSKPYAGKGAQNANSSDRRFASLTIRFRWAGHCSAESSPRFWVLL